MIPLKDGKWSVYKLSMIIPLFGKPLLKDERPTVTNHCLTSRNPFFSANGLLIKRLPRLRKLASDDHKTKHE